jgi:8-oxo-dGTP pyrophosphatase MutT (NUDIX family)
LEVAERGDSRIFRQLQARRRSPHTGREHAFTRLLGPDWVNVIAFTEDLELLVVEQFRHGIDGPTWEIPGGGCDPGEAPDAAARRELEEEAGYRPGAWIPLGSCTPNPATQANRCHTFLALDCRPAAELSLDPAEELRLWAFGWGEWEDRLRSGEVHHALVLTAFLKLRLWEGWPELEGRLQPRPC